MINIFYIYNKTGITLRQFLTNREITGTSISQISTRHKVSKIGANGGKIKLEAGFLFGRG